MTSLHLLFTHLHSFDFCGSLSSYLSSLPRCLSDFLPLCTASNCGAIQDLCTLSPTSLHSPNNLITSQISNLIYMPVILKYTFSTHTSSLKFTFLLVLQVVVKKTELFIYTIYQIYLQLPDVCWGQLTLTCKRQFLSFQEYLNHLLDH